MSYRGETRQIVFLEAAISLKVEDFPNLGGGLKEKILAYPF
jgi:hypothetical protein